MPDLARLRAYIDSNVLFSASLKVDSDFLNLWRLREVVPVVSHYAIDEVVRNVASAAHNARLSMLLTRTQIVSDADVRLIPSHARLVLKDQPILAAAIAASVDYLITGDKAHFGHLYNKKIAHVYVINPSDFLALYEERLPQ